MALRHVVVDDTDPNLTFKRGPTVTIIVGYEDFYFVSANDDSFEVVGGTITALGKIDVFVNGVQVDEGATEDWERNTGTNSIDFNYTVPSGARVRVRILDDDAPPFQDFFFTAGTGGQSNFVVVGGYVTDVSKIDVFRNGVLVREGAGADQDFLRNPALNRIEFNNPVPENGKVRVRLYT